MRFISRRNALRRGSAHATAGPSSLGGTAPVSADSGSSESVGRSPAGLSNKAELRQLLLADRVEVFGEAFVLDLTIAHLDTDPRNSDQQLSDLEEGVTTVIRKRLRSRGYQSDHVERTSTGYRIRTYTNIGSALSPLFLFAGGGSALRGEAWLKSVFKLQEEIRAKTSDFLRKKGYSSAVVAATWQPGTGVILSGGILSESATSDDYEEQVWTLKTKYRTTKRRAAISTYVLIGVLAVGALLVIVSAIQPDADFFVIWLISGYAMFYAIVLAVGISHLWSDSQEARENLREVLARIDIMDVTNEKERRAYKLFQINNAELKRYYDQALRQRGGVFILGILCILGGFGSIAWATVTISTLDEAELPEKILVATLGAVGAILADFIAVIFLRMFSGIVQSTVDFHLRLVATHHAHFGSVLAARIDDQALADATLAKLALALVPTTGPGAPSAQDGSVNPNSASQPK